MPETKGLKSVSYITVDRAQWETHKKTYDTIPWEYKDEKMDSFSLANDWMFYRFCEGAINAGCVEDRYALSLSRMIKRSWTVSEYYDSRSHGNSGW